MKRIISVLTVMAIMAAMLAVMAAPAFAKIINPDPTPGPPPLETPRPPAETSNGPFKATVTHCNSPSIGGEGTFVFNNNGIKGPGNCLQ